MSDRKENPQKRPKPSDSSPTGASPKARRTLLKGSNPSTGSLKGKGKAKLLVSQDHDEEMQEAGDQGVFPRGSGADSDSDSVIVLPDLGGCEPPPEGISQIVNRRASQGSSRASAFGMADEGPSRLARPKLKRLPLIQKGVIYHKDKSEEVKIPQVILDDLEVTPDGIYEALIERWQKDEKLQMEMWLKEDRLLLATVYGCRMV